MQVRIDPTTVAQGDPVIHRDGHKGVVTYAGHAHAGVLYVDWGSVGPRPIGVQRVEIGWIRKEVAS